MITHKLRLLLEDYHAKRWFPQKYHDPFGELRDWITTERVREFQSEYEKAGKIELLAVAAYLAKLLPEVQYPDLFKEYKRAYGHALLEKSVLPPFTYYYLRALNEEQAHEVWQNLFQWTVQWRSALQDWLCGAIYLERSFEKLSSAHWDRAAEIVEIRNDLKSSREIFEWERKRETSAKSVLEILRFLRLSSCDQLADWRDLPAFAKNVIQTCRIRRKPRLRKSEWNAAVQYTAPIQPPKLVRVEYGEAAGPVDTMRFLFELGQSLFYKGMDPELEIESRICGDPAVPLFWGYIFSGLLTDRSGIQRLIGHRAEDLSRTLDFASKFRDRYDAALAIYRENVDTELKGAQDLYVDSFETAFSFEAPHSLHLLDLDRASDAFYRVVAQRKAILAAERFRELYGREWFTSERLARRIQDYWWQGFRLTLQDILRDLF